MVLAKAGIAMATIIAAITHATTTKLKMRLMRNSLLSGNPPWVAPTITE